MRFFSDTPHWMITPLACQVKKTYFTAVLELGDMFDGGGVPIDHYIIQVDNGTQLETPGPTYSFDIMYNTTLSVNISAHNCAGYSDPFQLDIQYDVNGSGSVEIGHDVNSPGSTNIINYQGSIVN